MDDRMYKDKAKQASGPSSWDPLFDTLNYYFSFLRSLTILLWASFIIHRFDHQHGFHDAQGHWHFNSRPIELEETLFNFTLFYISYLIPDFRWYYLGEGSDPAALILACVVFIIFFVPFVRKHRNDTYQTHFIASAIALGICADAAYVCVFGTWSNFFFYLKTFVPFWVVVAVGVSAWYHGNFKYRQHPKYNVWTDILNMVYGREEGEEGLELRDKVPGESVALLTKGMDGSARQAEL